jgi:SAM-dependent methyltransferase
MTTFQNTGMPDWDWWSECFPDPVGVLRAVGLLDVDSLVDVASGDGFFTVPAAHHVDTVYAVDLESDLLAALGDHAADAGVEVTTVEGDVRGLPTLLPEQVEGALLANVFHGVDDRPGLARAVADTLEPGGRFAVVNWDDRPRAETTLLGEPRGPPTDLRIVPEVTQTAVADAGFEVVDTVDLPPYHHAVVCEHRG